MRQEGIGTGSTWPLPGRAAPSLLPPPTRPTSRSIHVGRRTGAEWPYGTHCTAGDSEIYLRRVDLATRVVTKLPGSEGLWSPKCARDGRILAFDVFARRAHAKNRAGNGFFKVWDPATGRWTAFMDGEER